MLFYSKQTAVVELQMTEKREHFVGIAGYQPCHDDDEVKLVPLVTEVTIGAKNPQGHHLDDHFHSEESKDAVVQHLKKDGEENRHADGINV